ncbi:MAG: glycoside hydrolase family 97 protein [Bacteroidota bacterium]
MSIKYFFVVIVYMLVSISCKQESSFITEVTSPNEKIKLNFDLSSKGELSYCVVFDNNTVIDTSYLSFDLKDQPSIKDGFRIVSSQLSSFDETWQMKWGEQVDVRNNYNLLVIKLQESKKPNRKLNLEFKLYDDGLGFRYVFPEQENLKEVIITDENTEFDLTEDYKVWWIPGDWDIYEHLYNTSKLSEIDAISKSKHLNLAQSYIPENAVNTPVTMRSENGLHLSFHEAALVDYSGMTLKVDSKNLSLTSELVGSDINGYKVKRSTPFSTPWRTIQIAEKATDLIESNLIVNLNEPNKIGDISWFKPKKYSGIWWEMHLFKSSWDLNSGKHGATTEKAKELIDFSAENNIKGMLVEGWNTGWEHWVGFEDREGVFDFVTPYLDYDLKEVVRYGKEKGVELIMHHETSAAPRTYEQQQDTAYALMKSLGIHSVKTGYVGKIIPKGEYHHGQWMVNHYNNTVEKAAKYQIAINAHEPIKATGLRRTYPNTISREGLRGQEFNAWASDGGNPPEHLPIVAFTRMLSGPIDFTPGIFDIKFDKYREENQVNTTLAHQLALYVVIYSPIQMVPDLMENYKGNEAFQFIKDVGVDWQKTKVLNGEVGDFTTIARQEKDTGNWFVGSITDENRREFDITLDFLDENETYEATFYKDGVDAHWDKNPTSIEIEKIKVNNKSKIKLNLAEGGGVAISIIKN